MYVSEQTARILYYGTQAPNEDAFLVPSDHTNELFDEVQLADYPNERFERCGWIDIGGGENGEDEEVAYMSEKVRNAE